MWTVVWGQGKLFQSWTLPLLPNRGGSTWVAQPAMPRVDPPWCCPCFQMCQLLFQTALATCQMPEPCWSHPLGDTSSVRCETDGRCAWSCVDVEGAFPQPLPVLLLRKALARADSRSEKHGSIWGAASPRHPEPGSATLGRSCVECEHQQHCPGEDEWR